MINPFKKSYAAKELNLFRFLANIRVFEKLTYDEMSHFLPYLYTRDYKNEEVVFFRGDPANALYIIKNGKVTINIDIKDRFEILKISKTGEAFGDNALLEHSIRIYNAIVDSETAELYVIPKVNIFEIFDEHERIKAKMITSLAEIYNNMTTNLFKSYKSSLGFFNLSQIFLDPSELNKDIESI